MREPRYPSFRFPRPERRSEPSDALITALMWGCLIVVVVALAELALLWWLP